MLGIENAEGETLDQVAHDFISFLSTQSYFVQHALIIKLLSVLLSLLDGGKQTESEYDTISQNAVHAKIHFPDPTQPAPAAVAETTA